MTSSDTPKQNSITDDVSYIDPYNVSDWLCYFSVKIPNEATTNDRDTTQISVQGLDGFK